jgi:GAF domain-containing protein
VDSREEWLARTFVELADTLVAEFDVIDLTSVLVERCSELLGSTEVGLALADSEGRLRVLASTSERMRMLELIEVQNDEGPCRDCYSRGDRIVNHRLDRADDPWPNFTPRALRAGFQMVHALPLRLRSDTIGAMNIFNEEPRELTPQDVNVAQALADAATIAILQERAVKRGAQLASQLQGALNSRIVVEQAKGMVAERIHVGMDEAFNLFRGYARSECRRLSEVAAELIDGTLAVTTISTGRQSEISVADEEFEEGAGG